MGTWALELVQPLVVSAFEIAFVFGMASYICRTFFDWATGKRPKL